MDGFFLPAKKRAEIIEALGDCQSKHVFFPINWLMQLQPTAAPQPPEADEEKPKKASRPKTGSQRAEEEQMARRKAADVEKAAQ